jgi:hypothetical protein
LKKYILYLLISFAASQSTAQSFVVGAAQKNINPDHDSLYLAGGKPNRPFIDVHDSLYVKAVFIENKTNHIVLLSFDCIGLMYPSLLEIREEVKKQIPTINPATIVMGSTHTHAGPDVVGIWGKDFAHTGINSAHMKKIVTAAVDAIRNAYQNKKACRMEYAKGSFGEDWVKNISEPDEIDRDVWAIRFKTSSNQSIATLTNFACHPTIMDDATTAASADYIWGYYRYLDSAQGGVNLFFQGPIGGWVQPEDVPSSFENALHYGNKLGAYVFERLKQAQQNKQNKIEFKSKQISFPMVNPAFNMLSKAGVIQRNFGEKVESEIVAFSIGDAQFATHPGETVPAMGTATKSMMKGRGPKIVIGLGQDALGYILKPSFFNKDNKIPHSEYLTGMSIGPQTMDIIMQTLSELMQKRNN